MNLLWKIALDGDEAGRLLFAKLSATEAKCNACQKQIKMSNRGPANQKNLFAHPDHQKKLQEIEEAEKVKIEAMKQGMTKFVVKGTGDLSALDKKIMHDIACTNQSFAVVEAETFKPLFMSADREQINGEKHYREWVLPQVYAAVKK